LRDTRTHEAGNASLRTALLAAVERSGKLDPLILAPRRKHDRTRYRAKRAAARRERAKREEEGSDGEAVLVAVLPVHTSGSDS
jgi:hypothetical protein